MSDAGHFWRIVGADGLAALAGRSQLPPDAGIGGAWIVEVFMNREHRDIGQHDGGRVDSSVAKPKAPANFGPCGRVEELNHPKPNLRHRKVLQKQTTVWGGGGGAKKTLPRPQGRGLCEASISSATCAPSFIFCCSFSREGKIHGQEAPPNKMTPDPPPILAVTAAREGGTEGLHARAGALHSFPLSSIVIT